MFMASGRSPSYATRSWARSVSGQDRLVGRMDVRHAVDEIQAGPAATSKGRIGGTHRPAAGSEARIALREVEEDPCDRLRVLELAYALEQLADRHAYELDRLVRRRPRLTLLDVLRDEEPHPFAAEAGRGVEGGELAPRAAPQARLLLELALRCREGLLPLLERPRWKLQQLLAR